MECGLEANFEARLVSDFDLDSAEITQGDAKHLKDGPDDCLSKDPLFVPMIAREVAESRSLAIKVLSELRDA